jgi:streptomycin 3"-adenylyltransferase
MTQLDDIVRLVRRVLGDDAIGAYLHGSAVLGEMRPRSDTDVLVVSRRRMSLDERRLLVDGLFGISGGGPPVGQPRPVELTVVVQGDVRPWRYPPRSEFQYGEWLRDDFERGQLPEPSAESPDLAPLITMVLHGNRPVFGPPPAEVLDPVPPDDLVRAIVAGIPGLLDDLASDSRNVVLTLARIWATAATGAIRSKDAAADWVLPRLAEEHRVVLARARAIYVGQEEERWDDLRPRLRAYADDVIAEIERAVAGGPHGGPAVDTPDGPLLRFHDPTMTTEPPSPVRRFPSRRPSQDD